MPRDKRVSKRTARYARSQVSLPSPLVEEVDAHGHSTDVIVSTEEFEKAYFSPKYSANEELNNLSGDLHSLTIGQVAPALISTTSTSKVLLGPVRPPVGPLKNTVFGPFSVSPPNNLLASQAEITPVVNRTIPTSPGAAKRLKSFTEAHRVALHG